MRKALKVIASVISAVGFVGSLITIYSFFTGNTSVASLHLPPFPIIKNVADPSASWTWLWWAWPGVGLTIVMAFMFIREELEQHNKPDIVLFIFIIAFSAFGSAGICLIASFGIYYLLGDITKNYELSFIISLCADWLTCLIVSIMFLVSSDPKRSIPLSEGRTTPPSGERTSAERRRRPNSASARRRGSNSSANRL